MKHSKNIGVVGLGNLGRRHLEALLRLPSLRRLCLFDPVAAARESAVALATQRQRADGAEFIALGDVRECPVPLDFCVIATNSLDRRAAVEGLLGSVEVKSLLLEKFLFPRLEDYDAVDALLTQSKTSAWVNCPRRMYRFYRDFREQRGGMGGLTMVASASKIQVGTHAIHFLDLFAFLARVSTVDAVDVSGLDACIYESKRSGYVEFRGSLTVRSRQNVLVFQTINGGEWPLQVSVTTESGRVVVMENQGLAYSERPTGEWETVAFPKPMQSELTNVVVEQLDERGDCDLPRYAESAGLHRALLEPLLAHQDAVSGISKDVCPIT